MLHHYYICFIALGQHGFVYMLEAQCEILKEFSSQKGESR
jgi:hypothetical protein